jgi:hypothetical protein
MDVPFRDLRSAATLAAGFIFVDLGARKFALRPSSPSLPSSALPP